MTATFRMLRKVNFIASIPGNTHFWLLTYYKWKWSACNECRPSFLTIQSTWFPLQYQWQQRRHVWLPLWCGWGEEHNETPMPQGSRETGVWYSGPEGGTRIDSGCALFGIKGIGSERYLVNGESYLVGESLECTLYRVYNRHFWQQDLPSSSIIKFITSSG